MGMIYKHSCKIFQLVTNRGLIEAKPASCNRPLFTENAIILFFSQYAKYFGPPALRSALVDFLPLERLKRLKDVATRMDLEVRRLYHKKKHYLQLNDNQSSTEDIGNGKDIISILRKSGYAPVDLGFESEY